MLFHDLLAPFVPRSRGVLQRKEEYSIIHVGGPGAAGELVEVVCPPSVRIVKLTMIHQVISIDNIPWQESLEKSVGSSPVETWAQGACWMSGRAFLLPVLPELRKSSSLTAAPTASWLPVSGWGCWSPLELVVVEDEAVAMSSFLLQRRPLLFWAKRRLQTLFYNLSKSVNAFCLLWMINVHK